MKKLLAIMLALLLALPLFANDAEAEDDEELAIVGTVLTGIFAPYMIEGGRPSGELFFTERDFAGSSVTLVNYWDSGCMNCRIEMPYFEELYERFAGEGISVLGVATRRIGGTYEYGWQLLQEMGITYPNVIVDSGFENAVAGFYGVPLTLWVLEDGTVADMRRGRMEYEEIELRTFRLFAEPGDCDGNGAVDSADFSALAAYLINAGSLSPAGRAAADIDRDLEIGAADINALVSLLSSFEIDVH